MTLNELKAWLDTEMDMADRRSKEWKVLADKAALPKYDSRSTEDYQAGRANALEEVGHKLRALTLPKAQPEPDQVTIRGFFGRPASGRRNVLRVSESERDQRSQ